MGRGVRTQAPRLRRQKRRGVYWVKQEDGCLFPADCGIKGSVVGSPVVQGGAAAEKETILELSRHDKMPLVADFTRFLKRQRIENQTLWLLCGSEVPVC